MKVEFELYEEHEGILVIEEPIGWKEAVAGLERDADLYSLVESFKSPLKLFGSWRDWVINIRKKWGPNARINVKIRFTPHLYSKTYLIFNGQLPLVSSTYILDKDFTLQTAFTAIGEWADFIKAFKTSVDISSATALNGRAVPAAPVVNLPMPSQVIDKLSNFTGYSGEPDSMEAVYVATGPLGEIAVLSGPTIVDGILTREGMRVLVKGQSDQTQNGVYTASDVGPWARAADANEDIELENAVVSVEKGINNAGKVFKQQTNPVIIGTSDIVWQEYNRVDDVILIENTEIIDAGDPWDIYTPATLNPDAEEIESTFTLGFVATETLEEIANVLELTNESGDINIAGTIDFSLRFDLLPIFSSGPVNEELIVDVQFFKNDSLTELTPIANYTYNGVRKTHVFQLAFDANTTLKISDRLTLFVSYVYKFLDGDASRKRLYGGITSQDVRITLASTFPQTTAPTYLVHDAFAAVLDRILQKDGMFYSERLGNLKTSRVYDNKGADSEYVISKVINLRGYSVVEKQPFFSAEDLWKGLNPLFNLACGFETKFINGSWKTVIEVDTKKKFFDDSSMSLVLLNVRYIERSDNEDLFFNEVGFGIDKGEPEDILGVDDPKKHYWTTIFNGIGKKFEQFTEFIYQSITIESARRQRVNKTTDYKYDSDTAIISVVEDVAGNYKPRLDEGFTEVTNLANSSTRYNKLLTPARILLRWKNFIVGCLQDYTTSFFKSGSGEGNSTMTSTMVDNGEPEAYGGEVLSESGDVLVAGDFLFQPIPYKIKNHPITMDQYAHLLANKKLAIGVSQTGGNAVPFFIWNLEARLFEGRMDLTVYPKNPFDIVKVTKPLPPKTFIFDESFEHGTFE